MADATALRHRLERWRDQVTREAGRVMDRRLQQAAPERKGELKRQTDITGPRTAGTTAQLVAESRTPQAAFTDQGTRPHVIRARRARALRFVGRGGQVVFRRSVNHPGNSGTRWWTDTIATWRTAITDAARRIRP